MQSVGKFIPKYFKKRIIIGGLPRSGSTLLRFILDSSRDIISGPETAFFTRPLSDTLMRLDRLTSRICEKLDMEEDDVALCVKNCRSTVQAFDCLMWKYMAITGKGKTAWAEKTPRNCFHYHRILAEEESIFFISTIRNGLDVVTSEYEKSDKRFAEKRYWVPVQRYIDSMRAIYSFQHEKHFLMNYEALCNSPKIAVQRLFDFLGIGFDPECLQKFNQFTITRNLKKVTQPKLIHPIQNTWINRWKDPKHAEVVDEFLNNADAMYFLNKGGYTVD